jgi:hypothetical protein
VVGVLMPDVAVIVLITPLSENSAPGRIGLQNTLNGHSVEGGLAQKAGNYAAKPSLD